MRVPSPAHFGVNPAGIMPEKSKNIKKINAGSDAV